VNTAEAVTDPSDAGFSVRHVQQINLMVRQIVEFTGRHGARSAA
jgi:hypothetical protein